MVELRLTFSQQVGCNIDPGRLKLPGIDQVENLVREVVRVAQPEVERLQPLLAADHGNHRLWVATACRFAAYTQQRQQPQRVLHPTSCLLHCGTVLC